MQVSVAGAQREQVSGRLALAACPVCHANAFKPRFTVKDIPVERCGSCGLVVQNPLRMGYDCVMTMVDHLQGKKVPAKIDTGVFLITSANMNEPEMQKLIKPPLDEYLK